MAITTDTPAEIIRQMLIDDAVVVLPSAATDVWPMYVGLMPDSYNVPLNLLVAYDTESINDGRIMATGERVDHPGIQIRVRAEDYNTGYEKLAAIASALDAIKNEAVTIGVKSYTVAAIRRIGGVIPIGSDESGREHFTLNVTVTLA